MDEYEYLNKMYVCICDIIEYASDELLSIEVFSSFVVDRGVAAPGLLHFFAVDLRILHNYFIVIFQKMFLF